MSAITIAKILTSKTIKQLEEQSDNGFEQRPQRLPITPQEDRSPGPFLYSRWPILYRFAGHWNAKNVIFWG